MGFLNILRSDKLITILLRDSLKDDSYNDNLWKTSLIKKFQIHLAQRPKIRYTHTLSP